MFFRPVFLVLAHVNPGQGKMGLGLGRVYPKDALINTCDFVQVFLIPPQKTRVQIQCPNMVRLPGKNKIHLFFSFRKVFTQQVESGQFKFGVQIFGVQLFKPEIGSIGVFGILEF